jgi:Zn-dependent protease
MLNGALLVARLGGTEIRLHWSMVLIIPYVLMTFQPTSFSGGARAFLLVGLVFFFVLLHELGHTLMARAFGIRVPSVVLWPLGGAAMTEREAEKPIGNLLIAAAGPLVNLIFGGVLFVLVLGTGEGGFLGSSFPFPEVFPRRSLAFLAVTNVILALTNLLPIYPLDGGRIFRAFVHMIFGPARSNQVTFWLSLVLGGLMLVGAIFLRSWLLALTAVFLLAGALTLNQPLLAGLLRFYARIFRRPEVYLRLADFDPALDLIARRIEASPRDPVLYLQRGYIYFTMDDLLHAMADADRALNIDPNYLQAILLKGALHYALENPAGCWACVERAEMIRPDWSMTWLNRAVLHRDEGNLATASADIRRAIELISHELDRYGLQMLHLVHSSILYQQGQKEAARAAWEEAYRASPQEAVMFSSDRQRIFAGDWAWVADYFAFLETKTSNAPLIPVMRGEIALRAGQWQQAVDDFTHAMTKQTVMQDICLYRGQAYEQMGKFDLAAQDYRQAIEVSQRVHIRRQAETRLRFLPAS